MLRIRRYRAFVVFAIIAILALYHFASLRDLENIRAAGVDNLKQWTGPVKAPSDQRNGTALEDHKEHTNYNRPGLDNRPEVGGHKDDVDGSPARPPKAVADAPLGKLKDEKEKAGEFAMGGKGRKEAAPPLNDKAIIHWRRFPEHFPIPTDKIIPLPTGKPNKIPKIQYAFKKETDSEKADREKKKGIIKKAFQHSWSGYKSNAWMHDELSPVSGKSRDPFCEWAATLVDTLDTLLIMDMKDDFADAIKALEDIDFTTSPRKDIPMFETTIRYLGGLISAYDLSNHKHEILIKKAVELAEVLMSAFDTPNRMPIMYYHWMPTFAKHARRSGTRVVMAEIGSLSVEFTRLAQITKKSKYYDAVARITNEFDAWQAKTKIPGLWPKSVDASGCKKPNSDSLMVSQNDHRSAADGPLIGSETGMLLEKAKPSEDMTPAADPGTHWEKQNKHAEVLTDGVETDDDEKLHKKEPLRRDVQDGDAKPVASRQDEESTTEKVDCEPQGLESPPDSFLEIFTLGSQADSTFEYLLKQYMLLGGLVPQYRDMYLKAADAADKHLIYRPMLPKDRNVLAAGSAQAVNVETEKSGFTIILRPEQAHLTCYTGGMYAIGAKIFDRKDDLDIAAKLTDGCVWAYEATATGIMAEEMLLMPCENRTNCPWNETRWNEALDPLRGAREQQIINAKKWQGEQDAWAKGASEGTKTTQVSEDIDTEPAVEYQNSPNSATQGTKDVGAESGGNQFSKRQFDSIEEDKHQPVAKADPKGEKSQSPDKVPDKVPANNKEKPAPDHKSQSQSSGKEDGLKQIDKSEILDEQEASAATAGTQNNPELHSSATKGMQNNPELLLEASKTTPFVDTSLFTHEEFVQYRLKTENITVGIPTMLSKKYILRPEAIESVYIMYRVTGDDIWRQKGWKMFEAIDTYTKATFGHSAIDDVTSTEPYQADEMESFWTAETLKYFYLLFSTPDVISLDDYVFNTEAHPFRRP